MFLIEDMVVVIHMMQQDPESGPASYSDGVRCENEETDTESDLVYM